jgi:hypothetical protein
MWFASLFSLCPSTICNPSPSFTTSLHFNICYYSRSEQGLQANTSSGSIMLPSPVKIKKNFRMCVCVYGKLSTRQAQVTIKYIDRPRLTIYFRMMSLQLPRFRQFKTYIYIYIYIYINSSDVSSCVKQCTKLLSIQKCLIYIHTERQKSV